MAFILNPTRKFTAKHTDEETGESFEADFEFILTEDCFTEEMQQKVADAETILDSDSEEVKQKKIFKAQGLIWCRIRNSLVAVRGIDDPDGNPLEVTKETQAPIFEFITNHGDISVQVLSAYTGTNQKNLNAGVMK